MPSPLAHGVTGYVIAKVARSVLQQRSRSSGLLSQSACQPAASWKIAAYGVGMAIAADFDFVLQWITGEQSHRGMTHSLLFCLAVGAIAGIIGYCCDRHRTRHWMTLTLLIYGSHLVLDFVTQSRIGIPLLWPLPWRFQSPIPLFPSVRHWEGWLHPSHLLFLSVESLYSLVLLQQVKTRLQTDQNYKG
ncbi:MAG: metal-dependent hydrolase [Cyanobacteria bacterium P01_H01_bin.119]